MSFILDVYRLVLCWPILLRASVSLARARSGEHGRARHIDDVDIVSILGDHRGGCDGAPLQLQSNDLLRYAADALPVRLPWAMDRVRRQVEDV